MMGFPDDWTAVDGVSRSRRIRMLGNAVQVQCAELIGRMVLR
jgi:site-specific DNA-cytosine methylase